MRNVITVMYAGLRTFVRLWKVSSPCMVCSL